MVLSQSCGLTTVATFLATLLGTTYDAQRQQLREWCYDAADQRGKGRRSVEVSVCFAPLLGWVLALWPPGVGAEAAWYGLRAWIECGCKDCKRGGWDWQQTKMTRPERASRLWEETSGGEKPRRECGRCGDISRRRGRATRP